MDHVVEPPRADDDSGSVPPRRQGGVGDFIRSPEFLPFILDCFAEGTKQAAEANESLRLSPVRQA